MALCVGAKMRPRLTQTNGAPGRHELTAVSTPLSCVRTRGAPLAAEREQQLWGVQDRVLVSRLNNGGRTTPPPADKA